MNWKLRLMNKATLVAVASMLVAVVYTVLGWIGVVPSVTQTQVGDVVALIIELLATLGVVVDPTTEGIGDSYQAMHYAEPKQREL